MKIKSANEFQRLSKSKFLTVALFAIACLPLIYAGLYLWAFWDPYGHIDQLPIAVVNNDHGATIDGKARNIGAELVNNLASNQTMRWVFTDTNTAIKGVSMGKYYGALFIPETFSAHVASLNTNTPSSGKLTFVARDATNMLATKIADRVFLEIKIKLNKSITSEAVETLFLKVRDIGDSLTKAANGSTELIDGLTKLTDGGKQLSQGAYNLYQGNQEIQSGLQTLKDNNQKLIQGSHDAATASSAIRDNLTTITSGSLSLSDGIAQLSNGLQSLSVGLSGAASGSGQLYIGSQTILGGLIQTASAATSVASGAESSLSLIETFQINHPDLASDSGLLAAIATIEQTAEGATQLSKGINQLRPGTETLMNGLNTLSAQLVTAWTGSKTLLAGAEQTSVGSQTIVGGLTQLSAGAGSLAGGTSNLESGLRDYTDGVSKAKDGTDKIVDGSKQIKEGSSELHDNLIKVKNGSITLHDGLVDGASEIKNQTSDIQIKAKKTGIAEPVISETVNYGEVSNYGTGFVPYFIPLSLWIGSLTIFFLIKPIEIIDTTPWGTFVLVISKQLAAQLVGLLQTALLCAALVIGLGLKVKYIGFFIFFVALISLCFITIIQCLAAFFGETSKFIAIIILMLQLTGSAGTFPLETTPLFFQRIHPFLPMTYAVSGLREIISGDNVGLMSHDSIILMGITLSFFALTLASKRFWKQPSVLEG